MKQQTQALWHWDAHSSGLKADTIDTSSSDQVLVKSLFSMISIGTERLVAKGLVPPDLQAAMAVPYMEGQLQLPVKYGYSLVGEVVTPGKALTGKLVHAMHPHQDYASVAISDLFEIPEGIPADRATLASNLETAVTAVWDSGVSIGDRVLVVGYGLIGALVATLLQQMPGVSVSVAELQEARLAMAMDAGCSPADTHSAYDLAFHTSGSSKGLQLAVDRVGQEGKVIELSWYGTKAIEVTLGGSFHTQRKQIIASQVSSAWTQLTCTFYDGIFFAHISLKSLAVAPAIATFFASSEQKICSVK
jgi:2-desacetyl-2-hydroxyethyl bacteriochlorophyllide A dehydrogenase